MRQSVEQCRGHLGIAEDGRPFPEGEIGGDDDRGAFVEPADEVEQELAAGLGEGQIYELVEDQEVETGEVIGEPSLAAVAGFGLQPVDEIDDVVEAAAAAGTDAAAGDGDCQMGLAGAGAADQDDVALLLEETAGGEVVDLRLVDRRAVELEAVDVLGQGQLGDGELVFDRAGLLLVDLGLEQVTDDALRLVLAFDRGGHDLVERGLHAVQPEFVHELEDLGAFHQRLLLRLS